MTERPEPVLIDLHCSNQAPHEAHDWRGFADGSGYRCNGTPEPEPRLTKGRRLDLAEQDISALDDAVDTLITRMNNAEGKLDSRASTPDLGVVRRRLTAIEAWQAGIDEWVLKADDHYVLAADHDLLHRRLAELEQLTLHLQNALADKTPPHIETEAVCEAVAYAPVPRDHLLDALAVIAAPGCSRYTASSGCRCWDYGNLSAHAKYGADKWCDPCVALAGLQGREIT